MLSALRDDALRTDADGAFQLRLGLPWIRSLPVASLHDVVVRIDGTEVDDLHAVLGGRSIPVADLADEDGWWFVQDRVVLTGRAARDAEPQHPASVAHEVDVAFGLTVPYLAVGPDGPLRLPFRVVRTLIPNDTARPTVSRDAA